ncbi:C40 family peptidase [Polluticaenibacter yanchengensis]|uniref:C40 family peptidase n=1 Tax=Polluticaenibacter yanchengensis TaxID=3014562 RepID=A0ABT4UIH9_9BACT|nr:C40 family peptidase [Chitinophagaceae bacterium LY-5]
MPFITIVPVAPLRTGSSHKTEMVNQLLFGEILESIEVEGDFTRVVTAYEQYEGWVQTRQIAEISHEELNALTFEYVYTHSAELLINEESVIVPHAANIPVGIHSPVVKIGNYSIMHLQNPGGDILPEERREVLLSLSRMYYGTAYLWGGKCVYGTDCSGYVQQLYKLIGIKLPRDAYQQAEEGVLVVFLEEAKPGDLAFFDNDNGRITHVGMLLGNGKIIHASADVHIDDIDNQGIIHSLTGERTHQLRVIKRYL